LFSLATIKTPIVTICGILAIIIGGIFLVRGVYYMKKYNRENI
jgi:hypothetical protein